MQTKQVFFFFLTTMSAYFLFQ